MWFKRFDWIMLAFVLALTSFGLMMIYSADNIQTVRTSGTIYHQKQLMWMAMATISMLVASAITSRTMEMLSYAIYALVILTLAFLPLTGRGVESWIAIGGTGMHIQPAEMAKMAVILALASHLANRKKRIDNLKGLLVPLFLAGFPAALVLVQPDLGTAIVFFCILVGMLFWSGLPLIYMFMILSPAISFFLALVSLLGELRLPLWGLFFLFFCAVIFYKRVYLMDAILFMGANLLTGILTSPLWNSLKPYQQSRILIFFRPETDPQGTGWQIIQSKVAIGSGGLFGKGFLQGTQKNLAFLPAQHTDFIFPLVGEEFGFIGVTIALVLFILLLHRMVELARTAGTPYGSLVAFGVATLLFSHLIINVGMTVGLMPCTGLPLPLFSYGGSFLITCYAAVGILQRINIEKSTL